MDRMGTLVWNYGNVHMIYEMKERRNETIYYELMTSFPLFVGSSFFLCILRSYGWLVVGWVGLGWRMRMRTRDDKLMRLGGGEGGVSGGWIGG